MKVGSLFSGIGGMDLGLEKAGLSIAWQCEIDTNAQAVLRRHWPNTPLYDDVTQLKGGDLEPIDLLCGGFPCTDLSMAGCRAGLAGKQSGLFFEFMRLAAECRPNWVLIENVPGLLSSNSGRDIGTVLGTLGELGYWWAYRVLNAEHWGVPQRRHRVFIIGNLRDRTAAGRVLFESDLCEVHAKRRHKIQAPSAEVDTRSSNQSSDSKVDKVEVYSALHSFTNRIRIYHEVSPTVVASHRKPDKGRPFLIIKHSDGNIIMRSFTPLECERLQGFPENWTEGQTYVARYLQLRNAVCVPVAEWIGKRILEVETSNRKEGRNDD